ncbi:MAG: 30S ribosomal protein THX [Planctomycetota bacterium]
MGRGDVKSRQGKIWRGSAGKRRPSLSSKRRTQKERAKAAAKG